MLSAGLAGLFFTVITYAMVLGVGDEASLLAASSAPFAEITARAGLAGLAIVVYLSAAVSVFACALASVNAVSRLMFSMGRYAFMPRSMGTAHVRHPTPNLAISCAACAILGVCMALSGLPPVDGFGLTATFSTFGFLIVYLLICIAAPVDVYRAAALRPLHILVGIVGVGLMVFLMFGSLYPVPDYPYNILPYLFAGLLVVAVLAYAVLAWRAPQALSALRHDLE